MRRWTTIAVAGAMALASGCRTNPPPATMPAEIAATQPAGSSQENAAAPHGGNPRHQIAHHSARPNVEVPSPFVDPPPSALTTRPATQKVGEEVPVRTGIARAPTSPTTLPVLPPPAHLEQTPLPATRSVIRGSDPSPRLSIDESTPATRPAATRRALGVSLWDSLPATRPAAPSRISIADPPPTARGPAPLAPARLGLGDAPTALPDARTSPNRIVARLPDSPAIAADAAKPAPLRLWSGLAGPTTAPSQRPQTRQEARAALADTPTAHVAIWTRGQPQPVVLPRIEAMKKIERSADYDIIALPLPGTQPSDWRSAIERTTARPELAKWLGRVDESGWQKEEQAKREETKEADRAAREKLRSGFYRMLLGE